MVVITIVGVRNQLITMGPHIVGYLIGGGTSDVSYSDYLEGTPTITRTIVC